ncbi:MAG: hypothetical protein QOH81_870 [Sphingomonadales bacterium]|jgi:hypothetical protein|nr:hypothetical protein [Sphingomonadales bacterium]
MKWPVKLLVGMVAIMLLGWVWHGPAGRGEAFAAALDAQARAAIDPIGIPGIRVRMARDPIRRVAIMSGPADDIQREGLGSEMGLSDYVQAVPGVAGVHWTDAPGGPGGLPLLAETWILLILAYALGLGLGALIFGRRKRQSYLD